ncbi:DUF6251 family protein [Streptomyces sp. NPDC101227]|uniref:DUF6251 family protein n=1 Tax=Streptomyces sp. NPDC101227 TaxID=3366136 RepID=UPI0037F9728F
MTVSTPRRYQFDNQLPTIKAPQPVVYQPEPMGVPAASEQPPVVVQHIHQAPPDRTVQRIALGAGAGGGAVAAGVYFGPLLVAALSSMAISLAVVALVVVVSAWGVVTVVRSIGGPEGQAAAKALRRKG